MAKRKKKPKRKGPSQWVCLRATAKVRNQKKKFNRCGSPKVLAGALRAFLRDAIQANQSR